MNKSDKYYLKQGKLELSMLEDEEDEEVEKASLKKNKDPFANLEFEHTRRLKESRQKPQQKVKINKEIYNTLHTMGQFLTKTEQVIAVPPASKKGISPSKVQKLEQIASSIKVQEIQLPPNLSKEERVGRLSITKSDQITSLDEAVIFPGKHVERQNDEVFEDTKRIEVAELEKMAEADLSIEGEKENEALSRNEEILQVVVDDDREEEMVSEEQEVMNEAEKQVIADGEQIKQAGEVEEFKQITENEMKQPILSIEECLQINSMNTSKDNLSFKKEEHEAPSLNQDNIDNLLESFFKPKEVKSGFMSELKEHIEKHIKVIRNYQ